MKLGYRVIDVDTHVNPSVEVLRRYADKALLERFDELKPHIRVTKAYTGPGQAEGDYAILTINQLNYRRVAGYKEGAPVKSEVGRGAAASPFGAAQKNVSAYTPGVEDDNPAGRLKDMDTEGVDIDFIIPGTWAYGSTALEPTLAQGLYQAYHRYMADYCSADPRRLKGLIIAPGADPDWAAKTIRAYAQEEWVAAVWPVLPEGLPVDDPDLAPIWEAAHEAGLPIMYHGFTVQPPYFPGYRDIWGNQAIARCAGQPWGAQRFLAYFLVSGILDRYPNLRVGTLETGHGWLPHWLLRLTRHIDFARQAFPPDLKHTPLEYVQMGRVFCGAEYHEGPLMTKAVNDIVGDHVLMYQSDYPHPECLFPNTVDTVLAWRDVIGERAMQKLLWENATRFLRLLSTPWDGQAEKVGVEARPAGA